MKSILQCMREDRAVTVNDRTFGTGGGAGYWDNWVDRKALATGDLSLQLFNTPVNQGNRTAADTNTQATQVPEGEAWDLYGLFFTIHKADGSALDAATKTAINLFLQEASYVVSFNQQIVRRMPLWPHFGSQLSQETAVSTTLALQSPLPKGQWWGEMWPEEMFLGLQSNIVLSFVVNFTSLPAGLNGYKFGAWFPRARVSLVP